MLANHIQVSSQGTAPKYPGFLQDFSRTKLMGDGVPPLVLALKESAPPAQHLHSSK